MKKLLLILLCLPMIGFGQGWEKIYDNSRGYSVKQTSDGGYVIGVGFYGDFTLFKTNSQGDSIWTKYYQFATDETVVKLEITLDGGYILCGTVDNPETGIIIKTDTNGNQQWFNTFPNVESINSIKNTSDGGYIMTGVFKNQLGDNEVWLGKTDSQGSLIWSNTFGGNNNDGGYSVKETIDGGFIIAAIYRPFPGDTIEDSSVFIIKTDSLGNKNWDIIYSNNNTSDQCFDIVETIDGYIFFKNINQGELFELIKVDFSGNDLWSKFPVGSKFNQGFCMQNTNDGGYIIAGIGIDKLSDTVVGISIIKTNFLGDTLWTKYFYGLSNAWGYHIEQTSDGGYIITGMTFIKNVAYGLYLIKIDGNGNITSTFNIPSLNNFNRKLLKVTDLLGKETKQTNQPLFYIYDDGTVEKRITID